jgi:hypothetical protein
MVQSEASVELYQRPAGLDRGRQRKGRSAAGPQP